jgi:hypothetical protein
MHDVIEPNKNKNAKIVVVIAFSIAACCAVYAWNYFTLQRQASQVISGDSRNSGIKISAHYHWYVNPDVIVFDLRQVSGRNSMLDVSRVLLQFAEKQKDRRIDRVVLSSKGTAKFILKGEYFRNLGNDYQTQNPVYTLRTLPENVYLLDGSLAFSTWTGGWLGVFNKQMEDLNEFHRRWHLSDFASQ